MIVIGDIHGNFKTLMALLNLIPQEERERGIVLCGDLVDRGPSSFEVVQWCIDNNIPTVRGNHEDMMIEWNLHGRRYTNQMWLGNGGYITLDSYKEKSDHPYLKGNVQWDLFEEHCQYMDKLPYYLEFPDIKNENGRYLVVSHSNIGNVWDLKDTRMGREAISWGRPHNIKNVPEIYNVIGHTPQNHVPRIKTNYACIDTGCFYLDEAGYGKLTALQFPEMIIYQHENIDCEINNEPIKEILTLEDINKRAKKRHYDKNK